MRCAAGLLLLACSAAVTAQDEVASEDVTLRVKPVLCILDRRTPVCDIEFLVAWESAVAGYYCLFNHFAATPLRCWNDADGGEHEEQRRVERSFQYWLTADDDAEPLAAVTVEVMTTDTNDRRRKRRSRHVWDIL